MSTGLKQIGPNKWEVRWSLPKRNGKYPQACKTIAGTKKEAQSYRTAQMRRRDLGVSAVVSRETLGEFFDRTQASVEARNAEKRNAKVSPRWLNHTRTQFDTHIRPILGDYKLQNLSLPLVQDLLDHLAEYRNAALAKQQGKRVTVELGLRVHQQVLGLLKRTLQQAQREGLIAANVCDLVVMPPVDETRDARESWTEGQLARYLEAAEGDTYETYWHFLARTGCRPGEALALRWDALDFGGTVTIHAAVTKDAANKLVVGPVKTRRERTFSLPASLILRLREHRISLNPHQRQSGRVFSTGTGGLLSVNNLGRNFKRIAAAAGIELRCGDGCYVFRHSHISLLIDAGEKPAKVAKRVGSKLATINTHYVHDVDEDDAQLAERFDLRLA